MRMYLCVSFGHGIWKYSEGHKYRGADKSLARPGKKQSTATEDFEFHISYL
jgi:hypothetical protein